MTERRAWILFAIAAATFLPALGFYFVGEEAIFPITSLEMWYHGEWMRQLLYGANVQHNPFLNWLIIPAATLAGWEHVLGVTRAVAIASTVGSGLVLAWLCNTLYRNAAFAAFAALVYLTLADLFVYRGWLAYVDPFFTLVMFSAMACLWVACERRSAALLALAAALLACSVMTRAFTGYVFYGAAWLVLLVADRQYRSFLVSKSSWLLHIVGAAMPLAWLFLVPENVGQGGRMFAEIITKLAPESFAQYGLKLMAYPLRTAASLSPAVLLAAYYLWRGRSGTAAPADRHLRVALWIEVINYLPYWLAPQSSMRYLMPLYPLAGLVIARILWRAGPAALATTQRWLIAMIALKLVLAIVVMPYYQKHYRGENYALTAKAIVERAAGHPLYTNDVSASGLSVSTHVDILRLPAAPLTFPPAQWYSGFVMAYTPDPKLGRLVEKYRLGGNVLYLLCRGNACAAGAK